MKLSEILNEAKLPVRRSTETSMLEAIDFIRSNCSEITAIYKKSNNVRLYRGMPGKEDFKYGDTSKNIRKSKNTQNYYTLVMDNDKRWKKFPKRSQSFICSTDSTYANDYGKLYLVFPVNGTKIAQCKSIDIWDLSKSKTGQMLDEFNKTLKYVSDFSSSKLQDNNYEDFILGLERINVWLKEKEHQKILINDPRWFLTNRFKSLLRQNNFDLKKTVEDVISPEEIILWTTKNFDPPNNKECWFSGKCVFINADSPIMMGPKNDHMTIKDFIKAL